MDDGDKTIVLVVFILASAFVGLMGIFTWTANEGGKRINHVRLACIESGGLFIDGQRHICIQPFGDQK